MTKFADIAKEIDQDVFYLDVYPFERVCSTLVFAAKEKKMMFIADPEIAERVVREVPKSSTYGDSWAVIGRDSIISLAGCPKNFLMIDD